MSKRDLSRHQDKIVKRYYEHRDTIALQKLSDMLTELYLAETPASVKKLWIRVGKALANTGADPVQIERVMSSEDLTQLARLITDLQKR